MSGYFLYAVDDYPRGIWVNDKEYTGCCTDTTYDGVNYNYSINAEPGDKIKLKIENIGNRQGIVGIIQLGSSVEGRFDSNTYAANWTNPDGLTRYKETYTWYNNVLNVLGNYKSKEGTYTFAIPYYTTCSDYPQSFSINYSQQITLIFEKRVLPKVANAATSDRLYVRFREINFGTVTVGTTAVSSSGKYSLSSNYVFKTSSNVYGQYTWYYYGFSITNDVSSDCKININICYPTCSTCTSTSTPKDSNHQCNLCINNYAKVEINGVVSSNCYDVEWITDNYPRYYYVASSTTYYPCYQTCLNCTSQGTSNYHSCTKCVANWHFIQSHYSNCVPSPQSGFILNTENNTFVYCYSSCSECNGIGNETNNYCTECKDNYIRVDKTQNCVAEQPERHYLTNDEQGELIYKECYSTCNSCDSAGEDSNHNCKSCNANYFYLEGNGLNCFHIDNIPSNTYWIDGTTYHYCYAACATCNTKGDENENKCLSCNAPNYWHEINFNCYNKDQKPEDFYSDDINRIFKKCFSTCSSCAIGGTEENNNCSTCLSRHYWTTDKQFQCVHENDKPENYYLDDDTFKPCHQFCRKCQIINSNSSTNCEECIDKYHFWDDETLWNCISESDKPDNYYWDVDDNTYKKCHENCATCVSGADEGDTKCTQCSTKYFFESENSTNCVNVIPEGYYLNGTFLKQCYLSCQTCSIGLNEDSGKHNCLKCKDDYYWTVDIETNCIRTENKPENYYLDWTDGIFRPCHDHCSKCSSGSEIDQNNCDACKQDYVFIGDISNGNCIAIDSIPKNYYFDPTQDTYLPCYETCGSCSIAGDMHLDVHNCLTCAQDYYFQSESSSNCIDTAPLRHYWDKDKGIYYPCYESCDSCTKGGNHEQHNCDSCIEDYSWIFGKPMNCINEREKPSNYYLDEDNAMFKPCHNNCKSCDIGEDTANYNCLSCNDGYYFRSPIEEGNCLDEKDSKTDKYYFDEIQEVYLPCDINCSSCKAGQDGENSNCDTCIDNYYFWEHDTTGSNCYSSSPYENYYWDPLDNIFKECYNSCKTCSWGSIEGKHNCNTCKPDYLFIEGYSTNCIKESEKPENYYWDTSEEGNHKYSKCHDLCKSCIFGGTEGNNNCWTCVTDDYALIASKPNNCIKITNVFDDYYYDASTKAFEKCFGTCRRCTAKGFSNLNNCSLCIENYAFIESRPNNCIKKGTQPDNYFYDPTDNTYKYSTNCYSTCENCFKEGNKETHYCSQCVNDWEYTTGSPGKGNCYDLNTTTLEEITLEDFIPWDHYDYYGNVVSGEPFEYKEISIDNYTMYYYTTRTVFEDMIYPIVQLNECEEVIRNEFNINEDEDIIIGVLFGIESSNILEYKAFLQTGEELNLQVCNDKNTWIEIHLNMFRQRDNSAVMVELKNKIEEIANKIQIDDWFNKNSSFYNDPCLAFSFDNKDYTLSLRQEIYEKDIVACGKDCSYNVSFISNNSLICKCNISSGGSLEDEPFEESNTSILSCLHWLSSFPAISETWAHWMIWGGIGLQIAGSSLFWFWNAKDLTIAIAKSLTNPPHKNHNNKSTELQVLGQGNTTSWSNSRTINPNKNILKSTVRNLHKKEEVTLRNVSEKDGTDKDDKHRNSHRHYTSEELNNMNKSDSFKYDKRSFFRYFLDILKEKLVIISLCTHERRHFPISIQIIIQTFILSLIFSWSSIFSTEQSIESRFFAESIFVHLLTKELWSAVCIGWISYIIGRILIVVLKYGLYNNKNSAKEGWKFVSWFKTKVIIISITTWLVNIMLWIYMFVFGMIYRNNQLTVLVWSVISIIILLIFQIVVCLVLSYLRNWTRKYKSSQCLFNVSFFAYWLL